MQKYRPKSLAGNIADHLFRLFLACAVGTAWFIYLWDVRLTSLTAGIALGGLLWLSIRKFGQMSTQKKEKQMRQLIGGELALRELLLLSPKQAGFQTALWLAPRYSFEMERLLNGGMLGSINQKKTLICVIAQHESQPVTAQQIIETAREIRALEVVQCLLCLTSPASKEAISYAQTVTPPIKLIHREEMIELAGLASPATDEQLCQIRKNQKIRRSRTGWLQVMLEPGRARRYFGFGISLSALGLATGQPYYPIPAALCLGLFVLCRLRTIASRFHTGVGKSDPFQNR